MQLMCHLSSFLTTQPFLMAVWLATSAGSAEMMPKRPTPRTLRISLSSQPVHFAPAARPSPMHAPMRTVSRAETRVCAQSTPALLSVSPHFDLSRLIDPVYPLRRAKYEAALLSLSRIMIVSSCMSDDFGVTPFSAERRRKSAASHALIMEAVTLVAAALGDAAVIAPVVRSISAHDQKPLLLMLTGSGCSKGSDLTGAAGGGAASRVVRGEAGGEPVRAAGDASERTLSKTPICQRNGTAAATRATAKTATITTTRLRMQRWTSGGASTTSNR